MRKSFKSPKQLAVKVPTYTHSEDLKSESKPSTIKAVWVLTPQEEALCKGFEKYVFLKIIFRTEENL